MSINKTAFERRRRRVRYSLKKKASGKARLSVFRSGKHIYAQIFNDIKGVTIISASSLDKEIDNNGWSVDTAGKVGALVAKRALDNNIREVVFDRGGYLFHGRVKALADSAREAGLKF